jgi:hypothetical protein
MTKLQVKLESEKSNYQLIRDLSKIVKGEELAEIIFYDTFIGAYEIRQKRPQNFTEKRQISSWCYEIDGIISQRKKTLNSLTEKTIPEILRELSEKAEKINYESSVNGIYKEIKGIKELSKKREVGEKIKERVFRRKKEIEKNNSQKRRANVFLIEFDCIKSGIREILRKED